MSRLLIILSPIQIGVEQRQRALERLDDLDADVREGQDGAIILLLQQSPDAEVAHGVAKAQRCLDGFTLHSPRHIGNLPDTETPLVHANLLDRANLFDPDTLSEFGQHAGNIAFGNVTPRPESDSTTSGAESGDGTVPKAETDSGGRTTSKPSVTSTPAPIPTTTGAPLEGFSTPPDLWKLLEEQTGMFLAATDVSAYRTSRVRQSSALSWSTNVNSQLFAALSPRQQTEIAGKALEQRWGLEPAQIAERKYHAGIEQQRARLSQTVVRMNEEVLLQMQAWRTLSRLVPLVLIGTTLASAAFLVALLVKTVPGGAISGLTLALLIFVLTVFAASPAVLLLTGKPLQGIDNYNPSSTGKPEVKEDKPQASDGEDSSPTTKDAKKEKADTEG